MGAQGGNLEGLFLSTLSVRRATKAKMYNFNGWCISIHALREESDGFSRAQCSKYASFLSTLSVRRATTGVLPKGSLYIISIHALREESDLYRHVMRIIIGIFLSTLSVRRATWKVFALLLMIANFYPRSP